MFFGVFLILALLDFNVYFAAIIAAAVSFALSLVFLDKQRNKMSETVHKKLARQENGTYADAESDFENSLLDAELDALGGKPRIDDEEGKPKQ
jgi:hypothetical protein